MKLKATLVRSYVRRGYDLFLYKEDSNGEIYYAKPVDLEFERADPGYSPNPTVQLPRELSNEHTEIEIEKFNSKLLEQKQDDKNQHIDDLMAIIRIQMRGTNEKNK